ncbi:rab small monomeric gtpase [Stylonychia lemnae]|uniref:Ras-related protein Rab-7b n=1 Tax=Stylonychia lemnae TaxID=5949 RepID=A0A078A7Z1_STYLE|nr:rab small monomeric gtpase [Stylonychia lemnae]|eukprot:CDW77976.1 rab small monomeric gtpase [Stylonychia lemnae]
MEATPTPDPQTKPLRKCFVKLVIIGDSGVGKTSLIQMFEHNKFNQAFKPTIGADFSNKEITLDDRVVTLQIWDTAGQERFQSLGSAFYRGADCCVLVYDVTNNMSFENLLNWKQIFLTKSEPREPHTLPFLVLGNKSDVDEGQKKISEKEAKKFCNENGEMLCFETSAKNNVNVEAAFQALIARVVKRQDDMNKILGGGDGSKSTIPPGAKVGTNNMNKRANRSTKTKVQLGQLEKTEQKKNNCAKCN